MKISKLFHWLYAFLMLLPVFFIGGRCLYVTFNKNAKDSYYGETINESEYVNIDSVPVINTSYEWKSYNILYTENVFYTFYLSNFEYVSYDGANQPNSTALSNLPNTNRVNYYANNNDVRLFVYEDNTLIATFILTGNNLVFNFEYLGVNDVRLIPYIKPNIYFLQYNNYSFLDNAFIYSVNSLNDVPLFSWAKTSFLVEPFTYISGLFGIESTSPINTMLSYWLAISIIWLVFDLIMYVPLLVHRWIDKAKLE